LEEKPATGFEIDTLKVPDINVTRILSQNRFPLLRNARHQRTERGRQAAGPLSRFFARRSLEFADL
jgi:hypothetical protein